jgi:hypothetical protein
MQNNTKINLYDIQVQAKTKHIFHEKKQYKAVKIGLFTVLAFAAGISIFQAGATINNKQSFADFRSNSSAFVSNSSVVKIIK